MCTHSSAIAAFLPTSSNTNLGHIKDGHHLVHHGFVEAVAAHLLQHATHSCVRYSGEAARHRTLLSSSMDLALRARRRLKKHHMRFWGWYEFRNTLMSLGHGRTSECSMDGSPLAGLVRHPDLGQFFKHGTVADFVDFVHNYAHLRWRGSVRARQHALTGAPTL